MFRHELRSAEAPATPHGHIHSKCIFSGNINSHLECSHPIRRKIFPITILIATCTINWNHMESTHAGFLHRLALCLNAFGIHRASHPPVVRPRFRIARDLWPLRGHRSNCIECQCANRRKKHFDAAFEKRLALNCAGLSREQACKPFSCNHLQSPLPLTSTLMDAILLSRSTTRT